jgi:hypothetical protein
MMIILAAFLIALIVSMLFAPGYRTNGLSPFIIFFFILFFAGLAGQYWIVPFGPNWWGVSWGPILIIVLIFTFLFAAPSPYESRKHKTDAGAAAVLAISGFIWLLFIVLAIAIALGYYRSYTV